MRKMNISILKRTAEEPKDTDLCDTCKSNLGQSDIISCTHCQKWFHKKCVGLFVFEKIDAISFIKCFNEEDECLLLHISLSANNIRKLL
jgi:hypothetical protein